MNGGPETVPDAPSPEGGPDSSTKPRQSLPEAEVLEAIEHVTVRLCRKFCFAYYELADVKQEAAKFVLEQLYRYDGLRPLKNFLWIVVKTRLTNLVRDIDHRSDPPCPDCYDGRPCGPGGKSCGRFVEWFKRNFAKQSLAKPGTWSDAVDARHVDRSSPDPAEEAARHELLHRLDAELPAGLRADYARMKEGSHVPKARREKVLEAAREILGVDLHGPDSEKEG